MVSNRLIRKIDEVRAKSGMKRRHGQRREANKQDVNFGTYLLALRRELGSYLLEIRGEVSSYLFAVSRQAGPYIFKLGS